ncbi:hypothetical protein QTP86_015157 [Hemibagrus guttatus]|nr:hypothetical protein QTP86_015157 [Hemibagrus guttatus]
MSNSHFLSVLDMYICFIFCLLIYFLFSCSCFSPFYMHFCYSFLNYITYLGLNVNALMA